MRKKILQIIPAMGWRAVYSTDIGSNKPDFETPIVCFALVEEVNSYEIDTRIVPFIFTCFSDDAEADNFLGCVGPGIPKELVKSMAIDYGTGNSRIYKSIKKMKSENEK